MDKRQTEMGRWRKKERLGGGKEVMIEAAEKCGKS